MGRQISLLMPAVYCVVHDAKVMRDLLSGHPRFWFHNLPQSAGIGLRRLPSSRVDNKRFHAGSES